ncbi:MAG: hypothetical protein ACHREM_11680 [Polyangiales bacterium]
MTRPSPKRDALWRACLALLVLAPHWRLLTMRAILATDDRGVSDLLNGEFPSRVEIGAMVRSGTLPLWSNLSCSGYPIHAGGAGSFDPMTLAWFVPFPPVVALNLFLLCCLTIASQGAFTLGRRFQLSRVGALLAGVVWAQSGFVVCNLRHPGMLATICWMPLALTFLDRGLGPAPTADDALTTRDRVGALTLFAATYGVQILAGFPQLVVYMGLTYGAFAMARVFASVRRREVEAGLALRLLAASALAVALAAAIGAIAMLPMAELAAQSNRRDGLSFDFAALYPMHWHDLWTFVRPWVNGDPGQGTYEGEGFFLDDFGYVGLVPLALAVLATARSFGRRVDAAEARIFAGIAVVTLLFALGRNTPLFKILFYTVPGMSGFRLPSRVLGITDLALAMLAGFGFTAIEAWVARASGAARAHLATIAFSAAIVAATFVDLYLVERHLMPHVDSAHWLAPPKNAATLMASDAGRGETRIYSPGHSIVHALTHDAARGWSDMRPYDELRELVEPNSNLHYGLGTVDCHSGISPHGNVTVWGDRYNWDSLAQRSMQVTIELYTESRALDTFRATRTFYKLLALYSVGYVLSPWNHKLNHLDLVNSTPPIRLYRVRDVLPRVRFAASAFVAAGESEAAARVMSAGFDPGREVVLEGVPSAIASSVSAPSAPSAPALPAEDAPVASRPLGEASIVRDRPGELEATFSAPTDGWLVVTDTHYPGWHASIDDVEVPIALANLSQRAVQVHAGAHRMRMIYRPVAAKLGGCISAIAIATCALLALATRRRSALEPASGR